MPTVSEGGHGRERAGPGLSTFFLFPMEKGAAGREGGRERGWKPLLVFHNDYTRTDENDGGGKRESDACAHIDLLFLLLFFSVSVLEAVPSLRAV